MSENSSPLAARAQAAQAQFDALRAEADLGEIADALAGLTQQVDELPKKLADIRERKYMFANYLEQKVSVIQKRWHSARAQAQKALLNESDDLKAEVEKVAKQIPALAKVVATNSEASLGKIEGELNLVKGRLSEVSDRIKTLYSAVESEIGQTTSQLYMIGQYLDLRDEASFEFLAQESVFLAAKATWESGSDDMDGVIFLTDQRVVFEQKEKTGKMFGLFGGKKSQQLAWELPLNQIESVTPENKGFLGGKDMLTFAGASGASHSRLVVEVKGGVQSKFWAAQITRMIAGETQDERAIQPDPETLEQMRNAPTACPTCGGILPRLVANQTQLECEFCGMVIRI